MCIRSYRWPCLLRKTGGPGAAAAIALAPQPCCQAMTHAHQTIQVTPSIPKPLLTRADRRSREGSSNFSSCRASLSNRRTVVAKGTSSACSS